MTYIVLVILLCITHIQSLIIPTLDTSISYLSNTDNDTSVNVQGSGFATRSDSDSSATAGGGGGISGGAIAGIIIAVIFLLLIGLTFFIRSRRPSSASSSFYLSNGTPAKPFPPPQPAQAQYLPSYTPTYPAPTHPGIRSTRTTTGQVGYMPSVTPGLRSQGIFYAPALQTGTTTPQTKGVRFGAVGVRSYR